MPLLYDMGHRNDKHNVNTFLPLTSVTLTLELRTLDTS